MQYGQAWRRSEAFRREPGRSQPRMALGQERRDRCERTPPRSSRQVQPRGSLQVWSLSDCVFSSRLNLVSSSTFKVQRSKSPPPTLNLEHLNLERRDITLASSPSAPPSIVQSSRKPVFPAEARRCR